MRSHRAVLAVGSMDGPAVDSRSTVPTGSIVITMTNSSRFSVSPHGVRGLRASPPTPWPPNSVHAAAMFGQFDGGSDVSPGVFFRPRHLPRLGIPG